MPGTFENFSSTPEEKTVGGRWAFNLLAGLLVFFAGVEFWTIGFSLLRLRIDQPLALVILLLSAAGGLGYRYYLGVHSLRPGPGTRRLGLGGPVTVLLLLSGIIYIFLWLLAYTLPDGSWDGLWYHNPPIHFWALRGHIHWITADYCEFWAGTVNPNWNGYPKGVELLGFILVRASGMPRLLNALQLPLLPLGVLGLFSIARFLGANRRFALMAAVLFVFIPVNIAQSRTTYVDTATASLYISLLAIISGAILSIRRRIIPWKLLPALGSGLGLVLAAKGTGVIFLPITGAALTFYSCLAVRRIHRGKPGSPSAGGLSVRPGRFIRRVLLLFFFSAVIGIAVGGYWYFRNYYHTGSPFHPIGLTAFGREIFPGVAMESQFPVPHIQKLEGTEDWLQIKRLAFNWLQGLGTYQDAVTRYASRSGGLGFLWLFACLPSIIFLIFRAIRRTARMAGDRSAVILFLAVVLTFLFFIMPKNHNHVARYTIWLYGLGLPCFAVVVENIYGRSPGRLRKAGFLWIILAVFSILFEGLYGLHYQTSLIRDWQLRWQGRERKLPSPAGFLSAIREEYPVGYAWANLKGTIFEDIHSGSDPVALSLMYGPYMDGWRMPGNLTQGRAFGEREIYFFDYSTTAHDPIKLPKFLSERRIRYVIWDKGVRVPRPLARLVDEWHIAGDFYVLEFFPGAIEDRLGRGSRDLPSGAVP